MSEEKKVSRKFTVRYATDEDYKRMNFYTIGTLYRTKDFVRSHKSQPVDAAKPSEQRPHA
jgi:hypothetical protein